MLAESLVFRSGVSVHCGPLQGSPVALVSRASSPSKLSLQCVSLRTVAETGTVTVLFLWSPCCWQDPRRKPRRILLSHHLKSVGSLVLIYITLKSHLYLRTSRLKKSIGINMRHTIVHLTAPTLCNAFKYIRQTCDSYKPVSTSLKYLDKWPSQVKPG